MQANLVQTTETFNVNANLGKKLVQMLLVAKRIASQVLVIIIARLNGQQS
jgi:hypothetical protein